MEIKRAGSQNASKGPADWFTGSVRIDPLFEAPEPARVRGASVTFEPGARTAWHTHPLGQTLVVTFGCGWAQRWGGPIEEIRPGDVVWFPPGEKHWHGATPTTAMIHYRRSGGTERETSRMDGARERRAIPKIGRPVWRPRCLRKTVHIPDAASGYLPEAARPALPFRSVSGRGQGQDPGEPGRAAHPRRDVVRMSAIGERMPPQRARFDPTET